MLSLSKLSPHKLRRPKSGSGFLLLRLIGWFLKIIGALLVVSAFIGFIVMLVRTGPTLLEALQFSEQKMAGFFILIVLGGLLLFVILGVIGAILVGIGFAFSYWGTEPVIAADAKAISPQLSAAQGQDDQG